MPGRKGTENKCAHQKVHIKNLWWESCNCTSYTWHIKTASIHCIYYIDIVILLIMQTNPIISLKLGSPFDLPVCFWHSRDSRMVVGSGICGTSWLSFSLLFRIPTTGVLLSAYFHRFYHTPSMESLFSYCTFIYVVAFLSLSYLVSLNCWRSMKLSNIIF